MGGAATLAAGNGMIEVTGNPLVAALYPDEKTKHLNWFHAFFPIGIVLGGIAGFAARDVRRRFADWPYQLAVIYLPILIYGVMVLPQQFPKTENAEEGIPVGEMFRYTLTNPLFLLMLAMMAITTSMELGPDALGAGGAAGRPACTASSCWSGSAAGWWCCAPLAGHFVERLAPTGMLLSRGDAHGIGSLSAELRDRNLAAFAAATVFAWGVAFFFPTMVGLVSERMPKTGSLGIVLTAGIGLGMAGAVGVPLMGKLADRYLAESLAVQARRCCERVEQQFPGPPGRGNARRELGFDPREVEEALAATRAALRRCSRRGTSTTTRRRTRCARSWRRDSRRAAGGRGQCDSAAGGGAGGQHSFRYVAPAALLLVVVFGAMYVDDRRRGRYRAERLERVRP